MDALMIKTLLCVVGLPTAVLIVFGLALEDADVTEGRPFVVTSSQSDAVEDQRH
ncbi:hypothetical protein [Mycolicibacterium sediminis]|uniref:Uncharacterized protein n=1 Tax=Mycolicibacterium sediminis TaxID=1286180 RepID=A0A7I7QKI4_9MYCO|nr:hypothetical protein [Mycolicibacterium sediminis]BBY26792.1 hypothetical protein MSEDJ_08880 [Mycolicibacterium sediminis]